MKHKRSTAVAGLSEAVNGTFLVWCAVRKMGITVAIGNVCREGFPRCCVQSTFGKG